MTFAGGNFIACSDKKVVAPVFNGDPVKQSLRLTEKLSRPFRRITVRIIIQRSAVNIRNKASYIVGRSCVEKLSVFVGVVDYLTA